MAGMFPANRGMCTRPSAESRKMDANALLVCQDESEQQSYLKAFEPFGMQIPGTGVQFGDMPRAQLVEFSAMAGLPEPPND